MGKSIAAIDRSAAWSNCQSANWWFEAHSILGKLRSNCPSYQHRLWTGCQGGHICSGYEVVWQL